MPGAFLRTCEKGMRKKIVIRSLNKILKKNYKIIWIMNTVHYFYTVKKRNVDIAA